MNVIAKRKLRDFWEARHAKAKAPMETWFRLATTANWRSFADVRTTFPSADLVGDKFVFNVGGNNYRVVCFIRFGGSVMFIKWVGTHAEYDKLGAQEL